MKFSSDLIKEIVKDHCNIDVAVQALNGYDEQNFLLTDKEGEKFILKVASDEHGLPFLDAQIKMINHLAEGKLAKKFQHFLLNTDGKELTHYVRDGKNYYLRILIFLEGDFWVDCKNLKEDTYVDLGNFLGSMDLGLEDFSHAAMHRHYIWDVSTAADSTKKLDFIKRP